MKKSPNINIYNHKAGVKESIDIETYLYGVLSGEMSAKFNIEALKAQAIAARTFVDTKKILYQVVIRMQWFVQTINIARNIKVMKS